MFTPHTFSIALIIMISSTICWGSWANPLKAAKGYRFELAYWDFSIAIVLTSLLIGFTMGSTSGGGMSFAHNIATASPGNMVSAVIGGFIFNIANLLLTFGIAFTGMAVAFPLSIGIALVEGVILSYIVEPKGNPTLLGIGVALALLAVILIGKAHGNLERQREGNTTMRKGVIVCIVSGILMGTFAPFDAHALTAGRPLTPYGIAFYFAIGALISCFVFNSYFMRHPLSGTPVSIKDYFRARPTQHILGLLSGLIWGFGMGFNLIAASLVGMAISYAIGQASPMVGALWGVFAFHEFRGAKMRARLYLVAMFVCYILALLFIARANSPS